MKTITPHDPGNECKYCGKEIRWSKNLERWMHISGRVRCRGDLLNFTNAYPREENNK